MDPQHGGGGSAAKLAWCLRKRGPSAWGGGRVRRVGVPVIFGLQNVTKVTKYYKMLQRLQNVTNVTKCYKMLENVTNVTKCYE